jgi:hypothetical protein
MSFNSTLQIPNQNYLNPKIHQDEKAASRHSVSRPHSKQHSSKRIHKQTSSQMNNNISFDKLMHELDD